MNACNNVLLPTFTMLVHVTLHVADVTYMLRSDMLKYSTLYTAIITTFNKQFTAYCCMHHECNIKLYYLKQCMIKLTIIMSFAFIIKTFKYKRSQAPFDMNDVNNSLRTNNTTE